MRHYFLIRFDRFPRKEVTDVLMNFFEGTETPQFISTPSTMITIFKSSTGYKKIYSALGKVTPPIAFFLIDVTGADLAIHMPEDVTIPLMNYLGKNLVSKAEYSSLQDKTVEELQSMLDEAISNEQYELCSKINAIISSKINN